MNWREVLTLFCIFTATEVNAYRILAIFSLPVKSYCMFNHGLMKGLARKGHQVDVISYFEEPNAPRNYKTIINFSNISNIQPKKKIHSIQEIINRNSNVKQLITYDFGLDICNLMSHEKMQNFIKNPPNDPPYDLVIVQGVATNCFFGFGPTLKVPLVSLVANLEYPSFTRMVGSPLHTSFYPTASYRSEVKTFWDRVSNTLVALNKAFSFKVYSQIQSETITKYLNPNISSVSEVENLVSLFIANTHYAIQGIRSTIPGLVEAAGIHIEEDESSLTPELKKWMDESKDGVILVTFGSYTPLECLPKETLRSMFSSFAKLAPIRFLMKATDGYEFSLKPPKNVLTMRWIPQIAVLKHKNTRLFVTHGGLNSFMEALYYRIPIVAMPLFHDHYQSTMNAVKKGFGLEIRHDEITEDSMDRVLTTILNDPKFREATEYYSKIFRDRPLSAMEEAIYWIEYIIKNGANSLRSPAADLNWFTTEQLDVYGFLLICSMFVLYVIKITIVAVFKC